MAIIVGELVCEEETALLTCCPPQPASASPFVAIAQSAHPNDGTATFAAKVSSIIGNNPNFMPLSF
jgi:hypothetical protein